MAYFPTLWLIPFLPLLGAAILGLVGSKLSKDSVSLIALATVFGSFAITCVATFTLVQRGPLEDVLWTWIDVGERFRFPIVLGFDALTAALMLVVTGVGFLIHVYSTGYMHEDPAYARYFAYLNFFIFAMSVLALGRSLPVMFVGWEGVGLASYLLIGFWYTDEAKAAAGKKAFITNRVGDFGFLIGMITIIGFFGTADFTELAGLSASVNPDAVIQTGIFNGFTERTVVSVACLALFLGACGKSAQIPLYVWLPDAMAGPTPVSALIHAATMVTAGVYMVARLHYLYDLAPAVRDVVAVIGCLTALFAATIALVQNDIKRVLAYSTVSQLGYMFLAAGCGAYTIAAFHLITHAFFKACLFLGSGAVIHALHGEQDMRRMGGLKKLIPSVYWTFFASTIAIAGFPLTSGFFSKDAIIGHAYARSPILGVLALLAALLTAFYMARCLALTFHGTLRHPDPHVGEHLHHPSASMTVPLAILAALALIGGALNLPHVLHVFPGWLDHALGKATRAAELHLDTKMELGLMAVSSLIAIAGLGFGAARYRGGPHPTPTGALRPLHALLDRKWYVDEIYQFLIVRPLRFLGTLCAVVIDPWIIDLILVKLLGGVGVGSTGRLLRRPQNGNVQAYATMFVVASAVITAWALWR